MAEIRQVATLWHLPHPEDNFNLHAKECVLFHGCSPFPPLLYSRDTIAGLFDELVVNTKKLATATSKQIEKWH
ncbi:unnamed protein product [Triticum turgidum subsp. durum]|uniref:Uncharacterized protein n=1 Tax=Triticum turgidum subsp. durum TaxID=4567 RepID=A0A9R0SWR6_TRITD|nr:unnamed protein product [Triticum turgidum subsp. durum]